MFKFALNAGHYLGTSKGIPASLSPTGKFVDEWTLNSRVCEKVEQLLAEYDGVELLRMDDPTGKNDVELKERTDKANRWGADFYLGVHHNGGVNGGSGGGIVAYIYPYAGEETAEWQRELYEALLNTTGLAGNRAVPLARADLHECRETAMPAVLLELGFMDSTTDAPVIFTDEYADKCARAIAGVLVRRAGLIRKVEPAANHYVVCAGVHHAKADADRQVAALENAGFKASVAEVRM